jgi:hypothetical protein
MFPKRFLNVLFQGKENSLALEGELHKTPVGSPKRSHPERSIHHTERSIHTGSRPPMRTLSANLGMPPLRGSEEASGRGVGDDRIMDAPNWEMDYNELDLKRALGEGSCGQVWLATWRCTEVAVKKLMLDDDPSTPSSTALAQSFQREAAILMRLRHPNVVMFMGGCQQWDHD